MDSVARLALAAICRSCHVRLRSDTFAGILDDSPMLRGVVSSSTLHALQHINNFLLRDQLGDKWTMAMSQDGLKSKAFMTVIAATDTRQGAVPHVCKMQVKLSSVYTLCLQMITDAVVGRKYCCIAARSVCKILVAASDSTACRR